MVMIRYGGFFVHKISSFIVQRLAFWCEGQESFSCFGSPTRLVLRTI